MTDQAQATPAQDPWPPSTIAWYAVIVLGLANTLSLLDRTLLSFLLPAIRQDFIISDTVAGLLVGPAFTIIYCLMGLPIARLADAKSRKVIVIFGVAFWSLMTFLSGAARGILSLSIFRMGVGLGQAALSPSAYSMMADYFPAKKLALPVGVFSIGVTAGIGLSFIGGAAVIQALSGIDTINVPLLGELGGWRLVFVFFGLIGVPVVLLCLFIKEPERRGVAKTQAESVPFNEMWAYVSKHWKIFTFVFVGYGATSVSIYGIITFTSTFYSRSFGTGLAEAGYLIGLAVIIGGPAGAFAGGYLSDWLEKRGDTNAKCRTLWIGCLGLIPPGVAAPLMPTAELAAFFLGFSFFFGSICSGPTGSLIQAITPNRMRAQMGALYQLSLNLVGLGLGPPFVGWMTDVIFADPNKLNYSLIWAVVIFDTIAVILTYMAFKEFPKVKKEFESLQG